MFIESKERNTNILHESSTGRAENKIDELNSSLISARQAHQEISDARHVPLKGRKEAHTFDMSSMGKGASPVDVTS